MRHLLAAFLLCISAPAFAEDGLLPAFGALTADDIQSARQRLLDLPNEGALVFPAACCKQCSKGKACGDSCISRDKQCHKGIGCACDS